MPLFRNPRKPPTASGTRQREHFPLAAVAPLGDVESPIDGHHRDRGTIAICLVITHLELHVFSFFLFASALLFSRPAVLLSLISEFLSHHVTFLLVSLSLQLSLIHT